MRALLAGSFDPVTIGHLDLMARLATTMDSVVVAVAINVGKQPLFTLEERVDMLREACAPWPNIEVQAFAGLVVDAARQCGADIIVRGIRQSGEFDRELQMAQMNRALTGIETLLLPTRPDLSFVTASLVREVARFGGDVSPYVPAHVSARLREKYPSPIR